MIDNTYDRLIIRRADGRRSTFVDSYEDDVDDKNKLFVWINATPRCGIDLYVALTKNNMQKRDEIDNQ